MRIRRPSLLALLVFALLAGTSGVYAVTGSTAAPRVRLATSRGDIVVLLQDIPQPSPVHRAATVEQP